ncbi:MAG: AEC family transporter [Atribacterota bacterium]
MFNNLTISLGIIFFGLIVGYIIQQLEQRRIIRLPISLERLRKLLQKIGLLFFMPISFIGALWIIKMDNIKIAALPFLGIFALLVGGLLGLTAARFLRLKQKDTGSMFTCGSFTNIGSIGGLICYLFLGEKGFAFVPIYKLFEQVVYYAIGFPIAKSFSSNINKKENIIFHLKRVFTDIFVIVALVSIIIGTFLNLSGIERPIFYKTINAIFIPTGTAVLLVSIGLAMKFGRVKSYINECLAISIIKFILVPSTISTIAFFLGYGKIGGGLPLKVVIILSSMPVAFSALIPVSIYDLNLDLANSCWLVTTLGLIIILPLLFYIISLI